ncbi:MAG: phytase [Pseudomonadota bacterium]
MMLKPTGCFSILGVCALLTLTACETPPPPGLPAFEVEAVLETAAVAGEGDAADDPAIWVAADPADSLILGTDKRSGLYAYRLDGAIAQYIPAGRINNVDIRYGFQAGDRTVDIAVASDRTNIALAFFFIDPMSGAIEVPAPAGWSLYFDDPYGVCLYQNPATGELDAFVTEDDTGRLSQLRLSYENGAMRAEEVRAFSLGTITEGCAVDDRTGLLYIAEENVGVWRYSVDPATGEAREAFAAVDGQALVADAEGVAILPQGETGGLLFVSSQGDSAYAVFDLQTGAFIDRFRIAEGATDNVTETDGIELSPAPLGETFPRGVFVAQDDVEDTGGQNFKFVDLGQILDGLPARE